jgi:hypothetical protein
MELRGYDSSPPRDPRKTREDPRLCRTRDRTRVRTRDCTRGRPDSLPTVLPDEPGEFVDTPLPIRENLAFTSSCNSSETDAGRRPSPARVSTRVPARVFARVLQSPESCRVPPESFPSPPRVPVKLQNHQKRLGKTRPESLPSLSGPLRRTKYDVEGQKGPEARSHRIHPARHGKQQSAAPA